MNSAIEESTSDTKRPGCGDVRNDSARHSSGSKVSDKRVAFFGFYGRHNFGDDLFGFLLQGICRTHAGIRPVIVGASAQIELVDAFHVPIARSLWNRPGFVGAAARASTYLAAIFKCDVAIFGGGSLFGADASVGFARFVSLWSGLFQKPVAAIGVSVGPFKTPERKRKFVEIVSRIRYLAVRDHASAQVVSMEIGRTPPNLGDLAFSLPAIYTPKRTESRPKTLIVAIHLEAYVDVVLATLSEVDRLGLVDEVVFLALDDESVSVTGDISRLFLPKNVRVSRFTYAHSITEVIDRIALASCVLTSKLHGGIVSYVYNVPTLLFCYQKKCVDFLDDNALPGPRESMPTSEDCIVTVSRMLTSGQNESRFSGAETRLLEFDRFLRSISR
ncbi:polysaccharide pyruvyl transferase WcaK-like protein [Paraburkholderia unamae]|uniref:polysaccharide pyruvyl transferase family protein n=1 Tax=Paraburkholderia unamae TaxID=219649 RepID=UPI000DC5EB1A|nr:polysaccharide pyruvyl transferase family protein [Paraburkholderia unamae]RAR54200.1 polysaccharide pyruvyl transferase WcaK-like protein [Paraburkholderia unamae]